MFSISAFVPFVLLCLKVFATCANFPVVYTSWLQALRIILAPRRQEPKENYLPISPNLAPFASLRESLRFGCGFAALGPSW
jgi:hypothetical protein